MRRRLYALAILIWVSGSLKGALGQVSRAAPPQTKAHLPKAEASSADYVGSEICATCHAEVSKRFAANPHWKLALEHGGKGVTCEACHGPSKAHVESGGDVTKLFQFTKAPPAMVNETCLSCHSGVHPNFERTAHGEGNISCINCHSNHSFTSSEHLLKVSEPKLCYTCHTDIKPNFALPFHHRVDEGLLTCSDCHNPHGTFKDKLLKSNADENAICTKCHADTLGPFVYEHPPLKTEGCTYCHSPHGSPNPRLLIRNNVNSLCLQCHTASLNFTAPGVPSFHNQANQYQACTNCHVQIHGSNTNSFFFK